MAAASPELEGIAVFARLKPVGKGSARGDVTVPTKMGKQKNLHVSTPPLRLLSCDGAAGRASHNAGRSPPQVGVRDKTVEFSLDWFFTENEPQEQVYDIAARDRVSSVIKGYNSTIMAYGQTGSGKTHTMMGPDEVLSDFVGSDASLHGIVPRASDHLFEAIMHSAEDAKFMVQCSYVEVYNNALNDLLGAKQNLQMRDRPNTGITVEGLTYETVTSSQQVMAALAQGNTRRVVAAMKMNDRSSRGHAIFTIYVKQILAAGGEREGKLNLVDLAGAPMRSG
jgi:kinesin family protein 5